MVYVTKDDGTDFELSLMMTQRLASAFTTKFKPCQLAVPPNGYTVEVESDPSVSNNGKFKRLEAVFAKVLARDESQASPTSWIQHDAVVIYRQQRMCSLLVLLMEQ